MPKKLPEVPCPYCGRKLRLSWHKDWCEGDVIQQEWWKAQCITYSGHIFIGPHRKTRRGALMAVKKGLVK